MAQKLSLRFNDEEQLVHDEIKKALALDGTHGEDAAVIKISENIAHAVIHNLFGSKLAEVFRRARMSAEYSGRPGRPKKPRIVRHPLADL